MTLDGETVGAVSEAEHAIRDLNSTNHLALGPLARLLLRTESIASSKIEGMQVGVSELARADARTTLAQKVGPDAERLLANIRAMQLASAEMITLRAAQRSYRRPRSTSHHCSTTSAII